jgi:hypothetical protein
MLKPDAGRLRAGAFHYTKGMAASKKHAGEGRESSSSG